MNCHSVQASPIQIVVIDVPACVDECRSFLSNMRTSAGRLSLDSHLLHRLYSVCILKYCAKEDIVKGIIKLYYAKGFVDIDQKWLK